MGDEPAGETGIAPTRASTNAATTTLAKPRKVLVIDDEVAIVELIRYTVKMYGPFEVSVAYNGAQGLEQFYKVRPDCVIVDVRMPTLDGYQVVRALRGDPSAANTPLIILSALTGDDDRLTGLLSGVDEYLSKPFKPSALYATLDRVMKITPEERAERIRRLADDGDE